MADRPVDSAASEVRVPTIVSDFDYAGYGWLVIEWPPTEEHDSPYFEVYRDDLPWHWRQLDYKDAR